MNTDNNIPQMPDYIDVNNHKVMFYQMAVSDDGIPYFTVVSPNVVAFHEVTAQQVLADASLLYDQIDPAYRAKMARAEQKAISEMTTFYNEVPITTPSGKRKWIEIISTPIKNPDGRTIWNGIELDVTHRKETDLKLNGSLTELRATSEMLQLVLDTIPMFVFWKDRSSNYLGCNQNFAKVAGLNHPGEIVGKTDYDLPWKKSESDFFRQVDQRVMKNNRAETNIVEPQLQNDGKESWLNTSKAPLHNEKGEVVGILGMYEDITLKRQMEEALTQAEKMRSVGGLAAGIAHEINNPLAGIVQGTQLIQNRLFGHHLDEPAKPSNKEISAADVATYLKAKGVDRTLAQVEEAAMRAANIVKDMLGFARVESQTTVPADLAELLDKSLQLAAVDFNIDQRTDFNQVVVNRHYDPDRSPVLCVPSQIQQVFLNILKNGYQAMCSADHRQSHPRFDLAIEDGQGQVIVKIADNGPGMDETTAKRIFEPFFTTKEVGNGTGLGMSVAYFIITQTHGGTLSVTSRPGHGATFKITLPCAPLTSD